jgi:hypothetical protein
MMNRRWVKFVVETSLYLEEGVSQQPVGLVVDLNVINQLFFQL